MDKALLVGINKYPSAPLRGCINDIDDMSDYLVSHCGFSKNAIRLVADERATTVGILERLDWLVDDVRPGDRLFFHYSGHGAQMATRDHQGEIDGLDEVICPVDFDWSDAHVIRDKDFRRIFSSIPRGCEFVWVSDSCHSGDLSRLIPPPETIWRTFPAPIDIRWRNDAAIAQGIKALTFREVSRDFDNLALISGCRSDQTSADAIFENRANGALTYFLIKSLLDDANHHSPLNSLIDRVVAMLAETRKYTQIPGIEGSPEIMQMPFFRKI